MPELRTAETEPFPVLETSPLHSCWRRAEAVSTTRGDDVGGGAGVRPDRVGPRLLPLRRRRRQEALPRPHPPLQVFPRCLAHFLVLLDPRFDQIVRCPLVKANI